MEPSDMYIHETAVVEPGAEIGAGARVWHHAHVRADASIGAGSQLGKNVYVDTGVVVGERCKIQNNVSVYNGVVLEGDVFVGPSAVFTNDLTPRAFGPWSVVPTHVKQGASIGANATLICGIVVGAYAMVAGGSVVTRDVADHELVAGNPARRLGWVCTCGAITSRGDRPDGFLCEKCQEKEANR